MAHIVAIDPGAQGAAAWTSPAGAQAAPLPAGLGPLLDLFRALARAGVTRAVIEDVGYHRAGNAAQASVAFARHVGQLETAAAAAGLALEYIRPAVWQRDACGALPAGTGAAGRARKRAIRDAMAARYPHIRVTLVNADALAILTWALYRDRDPFG